MPVHCLGFVNMYSENFLAGTSQVIQGHILHKQQMCSSHAWWSQGNITETQEVFYRYQTQIGDPWPSFEQLKVGTYSSSLLFHAVHLESYGIKRQEMMFSGTDLRWPSFTDLQEGNSHGCLHRNVSPPEEMQNALSLSSWPLSNSLGKDILPSATTSSVVRNLHRSSSSMGTTLDQIEFFLHRNNEDTTAFRSSTEKHFDSVEATMTRFTGLLVTLLNKCSSHTLDNASLHLQSFPEFSVQSSAIPIQKGTSSIVSITEILDDSFLFYDFRDGTSTQPTKSGIECLLPADSIEFQPNYLGTSISALIQRGISKYIPTLRDSNCQKPSNDSILFVMADPISIITKYCFMADNQPANMKSVEQPHVQAPLKEHLAESQHDDVSIWIFNPGGALLVFGNTGIKQLFCGLSIAILYVASFDELFGGCIIFVFDPGGCVRRKRNKSDLEDKVVFKGV